MSARSWRRSAWVSDIYRRLFQLPHCRQCYASCNGQVPDLPRKAGLSDRLDGGAVCIIAPISSWAAAVSGFVPGEENGIALFIQCIPFNFYALFTIAFIILISVLHADYGPMELHELNAIKGDLYTTSERPYETSQTTRRKKRSSDHDAAACYPC